MNDLQVGQKVAEFLERDDQISAVLEGIDNVYDRVFGAYFRGELLVDDIGIFYYLTRNEFRRWVIENNLELRTLVV